MLRRRAPSLLLLGVLLACVVAYLPSLGGGFVWDDHELIENNAALGDAWRLATSDLFGPTGRESHVYRPLIALLFGAEQHLWPGPALPRLVNLGVLLAGAAALSRWAAGLGARWGAALAGAAFFSLHPGISESVAWISGRQDLIPAALVFAAGAAFAHQRALTAGVLLAMTPFAKETYILAPVVAVLWCLPLRRPSWALIGTASAGTGAYLLARRLCDIPFIPEVAHHGALSAVGGVFMRFAALVVRPDLSHPLPILQPAALAGAAAVLLAALGLVGAWRSRWLAAAASLALLGLPGALAAGHTGLASDRYLTPLFAAAGLGLAWGLTRVPPPARRSSMLVAAGGALILGAFTAQRAAAWRTDDALFSAAYAATPDNARAAFHLGHARHRYAGRCDEAIPLYTQALGADPRARNNLLACTVDIGDYEHALSIAEATIAADPGNPNPAANAARAAVAVGDLAQAEAWAREALERDGSVARNWVLLGNILGQRGSLRAALSAFEAALAIAPDNPEARQGAETARRLLSAPRPPAAEAPP